MKIQLTLRQEQVISLVAQGRTDKEIAGLLSISLGTVNHHMSLVLEKLEAKSRAMPLLFDSVKFPKSNLWVTFPRLVTFRLLFGDFFLPISHLVILLANKILIVF